MVIKLGIPCKNFTGSKLTFFDISQLVNGIYVVSGSTETEISVRHLFNAAIRRAIQMTERKRCPCLIDPRSVVGCFQQLIESKATTGMCREAVANNCRANVCSWGLFLN